MTIEEHFSLYFKVLLLFGVGGLISYWGWGLYYSSRRFAGIISILLGSCLILSSLTLVAFCDPLFWRAEWRSLTFRGADRCGCLRENINGKGEL